MRVGIIGGGIAGLVAAYELCKAGAQVVLFEKANKLGGLAGSFYIDDENEIEKYYHFICKPDREYLKMMHELGIYNQLRWRTTHMGFFYKGEVSTFGDPLSLLLFPHLSFADKVRFGWTTLKTKFSNSASWKNIAADSAREWLINQYGKPTYDVLYKPLLELKFRDYASRISAAWMWARFYRLGNSRTIFQKERIGYLNGGSQLYIDALETAIRDFGGDIRLASSVDEIVIKGGRVVGIYTQGELLSFDYVISTVPIPFIKSKLMDQNGPYFDNLRSLEYIGVMVMTLRLVHKFSKYFWMNISDPDMGIAGIIEYTNLNPCGYLGGDSILYIPQYLSSDHHLYQETDESVFDLYCNYLSKIRPNFDRNWVKDYWVFRNRFAQPICDVDFLHKIPDMKTPIENFYLTDSYQLHPDDRTISNSTYLGKQVAELVLEKQ